MVSDVARSCLERVGGPNGNGCATSDDQSTDMIGCTYIIETRWRYREIVKKKKKSIGLLEIAKLANVSLGTVDRAMHNRGRIGEETRQRILSIARQLGYKPNLAARALSLGSSAITVAVCIPREIHYFFDQVHDGIVDEAKHYEHVGLQIQYAPTERLGVAEAAAVRTMMGRAPRGLIITPGDPEGVTPLIDEAEKQNIRVVCVASDAPRSRRTAVVSVDSGAAGKLAAELLGRFVLPGSQVAVVTGMLQTEDHRRKVDSFSDLFGRICPGGQVAKVIEDHEDEEEAFQKCRRMLEENKAISGLYVTTANCLPVCRALTTMNLGQKVQLVTSDLFLEMLPYFDMGVIAASIYVRPFAQGRLAVRLIMEHVLYGRRVRSEHYIAPQVVTRSSMHLFRETQSLRTRSHERVSD